MLVRCLKFALATFSITLLIPAANAQKIPQSYIDAMVEGHVAAGAKDTPELRESVKDELLRRSQIIKAAKRKGLHKKRTVKAQMELASQGVLIGTYITNLVEANPISESQLRKEYERLKSTASSREYKVRHILLKDESKAKAIIRKLRKGSDFASLAKDSIDPGSKNRGGDLGWSVPGVFVPPFAAAIQNLQVGEYTKQPVKTNFGYHVIKVEDSRQTQIPKFDEVRGRIEQRLQQKLINDELEKLIK